MKRKNLGIPLALLALLAGSFVAGNLFFSGGDSAPTATQAPAASAASAVATATLTPEGAGVQPSGTGGDGFSGQTSAEGVLSPVDGDNEGGNANAGGGSAGNGSQQVETPEAVTPLVPTPEPVAPQAVTPEAVTPEAPTPVPPLEEPEPEMVNQAPFVIDSSPSDMETGVALASAIDVTFSEAMDQASVEAAFSISPNVSGTFSWTANQDVMTFAADVPFDYNAKVEWGIDKSAKDEAGLEMPTDRAGSFFVLRQKTINLYSQPSRDGFVFAPPVNSLQPVVTAGFGGHNSLLAGSWKRGFLSFDLTKLPDTTVDITSAQLSIHQRAHHAQAYTAETGALWLVSLPYGDLDVGDYLTPTPTICPNICYPLGTELSSNAADGWKGADLTLLVRADLSADRELSQFRLQFLNENKGAGPDVWAEFHSGEAMNQAPVLQVTYVYK